MENILTNLFGNGLAIGGFALVAIAAVVYWFFIR